MGTRDRILTAALGTYAQHGFRGATTRQIARAAGVNEVTLFRHFGSKAELLREALAQGDTGADRVRLPAKPEDPVSELERWAASRLRELRARRAVIRTGLGEAGERPELAEPAAAAVRDAHAELSGYLTALPGKADSEARAAAAVMLVGTLLADALVRDVAPGVFPAPGTAARRYVAVLLRAAQVGGPDAPGPAVRATAPPYVPDATGI